MPAVGEVFLFNALWMWHQWRSGCRQICKACWIAASERLCTCIYQSSETMWDYWAGFLNVHQNPGFSFAQLCKEWVQIIFGWSTGRPPELMVVIESVSCILKRELNFPKLIELDVQSRSWTARSQHDIFEMLQRKDSDLTSDFFFFLEHSEDKLGDLKKL